MFDIRITDRVHQMLAPYIHKGDVVIDGTSGNGNDTLFLAKHVGSQGTVIGFDIQKKALEATCLRIHEELDHSVIIVDDIADEQLVVHSGIYLMHLSHENIDFMQIKSAAKANRIACIMFNFGYLPGADKQVTTQMQSSLRAVKKSLQLIKPHGVISLVTYPGHEEGAYEDCEIERLLQQLPAKEFEVLKMQYVNRSERAPKQYLIYKRCCQTTDNEL
ncbi:class I SAM-dependent methyltransferase [Vallitaleaceae bacterium 9-2]